MAKSPETSAADRARVPSAKGNGTREQPWVLKTPSAQSSFTAYRDETSDPPALVVQVGKTELR
jgi:hypothetical protein